MTRRIIFTGSMFLVAAVAVCVLATARSDGWQGPLREKQRDERPREREGGRPILADRQRQDRDQATEDGLPEAGAQAFDQRTRLLPGPRWRLGVYAYDTSTGVMIARVMPGSPASQAGFEPGDRIVTVAGYQVGFVDGRVYYLGEELQLRADPRGNVRLLAQNVRDGELLNIDVRLEPRRFREPADPLPRDARSAETESD